MKKYICNIIVLLLGFLSFAQFSNWQVNENSFQYTMSFVALLSINGTTLENPNDKVAAFVDGECRGVAKLTYVSSEDRYYAYLTVFSNTNNETINFQVYESKNNITAAIEDTQIFEIDTHYGNVFQPYSITNTVLNKNTEITDFDFKDLDINYTVIDGNQVTLFVDKETVLDKLTAIFELSTGANLFKGTTKIISGENSFDFSSPVQFQVRSEDQAILEEWLVTVVQSSGTAVFYKKDAVCYTGGVIKVLFSENEEEAVLLKEGKEVTTQIINNGEALFVNLEAGTYMVQVGGNRKEIQIKQNN